MPQFLLSRKSALLPLIFIVGLLGFKSARATHIIGGYITYECLDSNTYALKLRVYRDCNPGNVYFDSIADLGIFTTSGTTVQILNITKGKTIPLNTDTTGCILPPSGLCVEYTDYLDTIQLPPIPGGYVISYQTCCRNSVIANLNNPLNLGDTYTITIPPNDTICNSSPRFIGSPPVVLCLNKPISLQLQAYDPDGDSLYYELCDILDDGSVVGFCSRPCPPPYNVIPFKLPYTSQNPLPANPPFGIDHHTGQLYGTPNQAGQYVVGICVKEFRNGVPLSSARLDYQFNITPCITIASDILTQAEDSSLFCQGLNMHFYSQNQNANKYFWDFGDTTTLADTSHAMNSQYQYSAPGSYTVTLIVQSTSGCKDTSSAVFEVNDPLSVNLASQSSYCFDDQPISLSAGGNYPPGVSFNWDFGSAASIQHSSLQTPPPVSWSKGGKYYVQLKVKRGGCTIIKGDTINLKDEMISDMVLPYEDSSMTCNGLTVPFVSESKAATSVFWDFGDPGTQADTSHLDSTVYTFPAPGTYKVTLIAMQDGGCADTTVYPLEVHEKLSPQIQVKGRFCFESQDIDFEAIGHYPADTHFRWDFDPDAQQQVVKNPSAPKVQWNQPGRHIVSLTVTKGYCISTIFDTVDIPAYSVPVDAGPDQTVKTGELINLVSTLADHYYWFSDFPVRITNPFSRYTSASLATGSDTVTFYIKVTDKNGCQGLDSLKVFVNRDDESVANFLSPNGDGMNDYFDLSGRMHGGYCGLTILNRWGYEVYHAEEYHNDWNGVDDRGRPLPDGTYYYILFCDRRVTDKGAITIIRNNMR